MATYVKKQETREIRTCANCGIDISDKPEDKQFCSGVCKGVAIGRMQLEKLFEVPKLPNTRQLTAGVL